ncbi:hypothetical protein [Variovorax sp. LG9.2]|uniref:hypothetical protein n=1 Tax=Variovorax sp. LG9.2 TaxID=3048626 RepID=UPI002B22C105|nr:hypothetical protein [Variovorax sp. LG9.2]MEB0059252.1 hypothetical protein [Variovorax sp. LG9.2]
MAIAIISSVETKFWYEPVRAASEAIAALTEAVYELKDEVDNIHSECLAGIASNMAKNELLSDKTLKEGMVEGSVAGIAFELHTLIVAALNYPVEVLEIKRRTLLLQALRITDALGNILLSGKDGPKHVPALLELINGREVANV